MKKVQYLVIALVIMLFACQKTQQDTSVGYLYIGDISLKSDVISVETKAPSTSDFTVVIKEKNTENVVYSGAVFSDIKTFTAGQYTVVAYSGTDADAAIDAPYYYAEKDITIDVLKKTSINLTASMAGATIEAGYPSGMDEHFQSGYFLDITTSGTHYSVYPGHKLYVKAGNAVSISLKGTNAVGEAVTLDFGSISSVEAMKNYKYNVSLTLPVFSLPAISDVNVWSSKVYVSAMSAANVSQGTASKIIAGAVYEASSDGVNWISSTSENGNIAISGLSGGTTYSVRARYGNVVSSNTVTVTTETAQQLDNNGFESWSESKIFSGNGTFSRNIVCYYPSSSTSSGTWVSRNVYTTSKSLWSDAPSNTNNYGVAWKWSSGTRQTSDCSTGSSAAEISSLAFYKSKLGLGFSTNRTKINANLVTDSGGQAFIGRLLTGTYNSDDSYSLGVSHSSRPLSISFDYKYAPVSSDQCIVYAKLYDASNNEIASTPTFNSSTQSTYTTSTLTFTYSNKNVKASKIAVYFASGSNTTVSSYSLVNGSYNSSPYGEDRKMGSILKIDNVILNY
ncbi:MAG: DUF4493 domain-containing protein [Flavobacteriales bacterium]|nr:DUF4493 domain-containing protein [Flavobacteriales bacterium]